MNNQDLAQAIKAYITLELEDNYQREENTAQFHADCDDRVISLSWVLDTTPPTVRKYVQVGLDSLLGEIMGDHLNSVKRSLTKDEELIIDAYVKEVSMDDEFLSTVAKCKQLLKLE